LEGIHFEQCQRVGSWPRAMQLSTCAWLLFKLSFRLLICNKVLVFVDSGMLTLNSRLCSSLFDMVNKCKHRRISEATRRIFSALCHVPIPASDPCFCTFFLETGISQGRSYSVSLCLLSLTELPPFARFVCSSLHRQPQL
jgi:hypothetical protein